MKVFFKKSFIRDFKKLPEGKKDKVRKICLSIFPEIDGMNDLRKYRPKKIKGCEKCYRIRIGNFRLGFKRVNKKVIFMRILHRKDIYDHFPG